jgi:hypothetical protein
MNMQNLTEPLKIGTLVKIRDSGYGRAMIVEYRGELGPKSARVYRVRVRKKPHPAYTEVVEDQLEMLLPGPRVCLPSPGVPSARKVRPSDIDSPPTI